MRLERSACVATLVLDRPQVRNALDNDTVEELSDKLRSLAADAGVRVVQLAGEGSCFSAGADLRAMRRMGTADPADNLADTRRFVEMLRLLHSMPKPTVARVQGAAVGGGVGLVACCDVAVASEDAFFRLSEVQLGLIPAMVGPYLVEVLGVNVARRLMLTAERVSASRAQAWGLIDEVVPAAALDAATQAMIDRLLRGAPGAVAAWKELVREIADNPLNDEIRERTAQVLAVQRSTDEGRAGVRAFLDKRRAPWLAAKGGGTETCKT